MREPKRIMPILRKLSYLIEEEDYSVLEGVMYGVKSNTEDPYFYEDEDWLDSTENISEAQELSKECHLLLSVWEDMPDLRLCQLACNPLQLESQKGEVYSKPITNYTDEEFTNLFEEYYF